MLVLRIQQLEDHWSDCWTLSNPGSIMPSDPDWHPTSLGSDTPTHLSSWCWNFQGSVRDDRVRRSKVWCWLTSLHSIFLGRQTALVRHWKVAEQPAVSASSSGRP